jgi:hypothetical protein
MFERFTSRKFIVTFATQIAALLVLLFPDKQGLIESWMTTLVPLAVMLLSALGYVSAEASVDRAAARGVTDSPRSAADVAPSSTSAPADPRHS